jgi:uncharacterized protein YutE (UPF0331/DUF86 family)
VPQETREAFVLLEYAHVLEPQLADRMKKMVGFRNVAIPRLPDAQSRDREAHRR